MRSIKKILVALILAMTMVLSSSCGEEEDVSLDKYRITVACQTEMGEEEVLKRLKAAYEAKNPNVEIAIKTFQGEGFEQYMQGIAADQESSPHIIWTADTVHGRWDQYFTDLRPYYEASPETDYSLYYETMLDAASTNGVFKPTKNYTNPLGAFDHELDANSDGLENYKNHSEHGLFYAPRDYNKPAILCNNYLFKDLDEVYEVTYKQVNSVTEMPDDYMSTYDTLKAIVNGEAQWESMDDLYTFVRFVADRVVYYINNAADPRDANKWKNRAVINMFFEWEPTYTTILNEWGVELIGEDGSLNLADYKEKFEEYHDNFFPTTTSTDETEKRYYELLANAMSTISNGSLDFSAGAIFMTVCSRPVVLGYNNTLTTIYGEECLDAIAFPVESIAAGNSGYAISNIWEGKGMTVDGTYKSYADISWDFIKFIISEEGQEVAGATGLNIPVLKKLYDTESNGGKVPAWRSVESLSTMNHDAWVAGEELSQSTFNLFNAKSRKGFREIVSSFFIDLQKSNYNYESLNQLISEVVRKYNNNDPTNNLR